MIISCGSWSKIHADMLEDQKKKGKTPDMCRTPEVNALRMRMTPNQIDSKRRGVQKDEHMVPAFGMGEGIRDARMQLLSP